MDAFEYQMSTHSREEERDTHVDLDVEVLEVERVLPDIDTNDWDVRDERVLVRGRDDLKTLGHRVVALS